MADRPADLSPPLRDWLAARRADLNARFRAAARLRPALDPAAVLALCRDLLAPLAADPHPQLPALLDALYDLILLHAGRGTLGPVSTAPPLGVLFREAFPALRPHLLARPRALPADLSNATENLGRRGAAFAQTLPALGGVLTNPDDLLDAGAVLAWRLGEARLRGAALAAAARLPAAAVLVALGLPAWPPATAPLLVAALAADGWRSPAAVFTPATLDELAGSPPAARLDALRIAVASPADGPAGDWRPAGRVGDFRGFNGDFDAPPVLLDAGESTGRHRFWVRAGQDTYRVDADALGWVCRRDPDAAFPVLSPHATPVAPRTAGSALKKALGLARPPRPNAAVPPGAASALVGPDFLAYTRPDSFRVRVVTAPRSPL